MKKIGGVLEIIEKNVDLDKAGVLKYHDLKPGRYVNLAGLVRKVRDGNQAEKNKNEH